MSTSEPREMVTGPAAAPSPAVPATGPWKFKAFISYKQAADGVLATELEWAMEQFAKPWYRRRAFDIFRDASELSANPGLWPALEAILDATEYYILLASPESAASPWACREVTHWLNRRGRSNILMVLTAGTLVWDDSAGDFDWKLTTALNRGAIEGKFANVPLWVDCTWSRGLDAKALRRHPQFTDRVASLSSALRGRTKSELYGEDLRQHRRQIRLARGAVASLIALLVMVLFFWGQSQQRKTELEKSLISEKTARKAEETARKAEGVARQDAEQKARTFRAQLLSEQSRAAITRFPQRALLLAAEDLRIVRRWGMTGSAAADQALREALASTGGHLLIGVPRRAVALNAENENAADAILISPGGRYLAASLTNQPTRVWDLANLTTAPVELRGHKGSILAGVLSPDGRQLALQQGKILALWRLDRPGAPPRNLPAPGDVAELTFSPDGTWLAAVVSGPERKPIVWAWDLRRHSATGISVGVPTEGFARVALDPSGKRIAVASKGVAYLWELAAPAAQPRQLEHPGSHSWVDFSATGRWLVAFGAKSIRLWDLEQPNREPIDRRVAPSSGDDSIVLEDNFNASYRFTLSPDHRRLLVVDPEGVARLWDVEAPDATPLVLRGQTGIFEEAAFSGDGSRLALADKAGVGRLWKLDGAREAVDATTIRGHSGLLRQVVFSPDGKRLAGCDSTLVLGAVTADELSVWVWDLERSESEPIALRGFEQGVYPLAFGSDSRRVVGVTLFGAAQARVWDVDRPIASPMAWRAHERSAVPVLITPDGRWLVSSGEAHDARLWDLSAWPPKPVDLLPPTNDTYGLPPGAVDRDGRRLVLLGGDTIPRIWDLRRPTEPPVPLAAGAEQLALSADGRRLVTLGKDGAVRIWDVEHPAAAPTELPVPRPPGDAGTTVPGSPPTDERYKLRLLSFSPDGRWLVARAWSEVAWVWDLNEAAPTPRRLGEDGAAVESLAFDGRQPGRIYTVGGGMTTGEDVVRSWDLGRPDAGPTTVGRFDAGGPFSMTVDGLVSGLLLGPDGRRIVTWSAGQEARVLWVWDPQRPGAPIAELRGHEQPIIAAGLSPDGRLLISVGFDDTARLWDLSDLEGGVPNPVVLGPQPSIYGSPVFAPGARWFAVGGNDGTIHRYTLDLDELLALAGRTAGRNLSLAEWRRYFPGQPYRPTFPDLPMPPYDPVHSDIARNLTHAEWDAAFPGQTYQKTFSQFPEGQGASRRGAAR